MVEAEQEYRSGGLREWWREKLEHHAYNSWWEAEKRLRNILGIHKTV